MLRLVFILFLVAALLFGALRFFNLSLFKNAFNANDPARQTMTEEAKNLVLKTPDPSLPPQFYLSGKVSDVKKDKNYLVVTDPQTDELYYVITDQQTLIDYQNLPTEEKIKQRVHSLSEIQPGFQVIVTANNFAGQHTLEAKTILIQSYDRRGPQ